MTDFLLPSDETLHIVGYCFCSFPYIYFWYQTAYVIITAKMSLWSHREIIQSWKKYIWCTLDFQLKSSSSVRLTRKYESQTCLIMINISAEGTFHSGTLLTDVLFMVPEMENMVKIMCGSIRLLLCQVSTFTTCLIFKH